MTFSRRLVLAVPTAALALTIALGALSPAAAAGVGDTGQLYGQSDHVTVGTVSIVEEDGARYVVLGDDFSLDGAPAPTLGFSVDGEFVEASEFAKLGSITGAQRYEIPAALDISDFDAFVVWCSQFSVPLGSADLN
ncbi:MAG: DM13 domain-containing protein [Pseudomonadota bacterium]